MEITDLEFFPVTVDGGDGAAAMTSLLVCISCRSGQQGWGEATHWSPLRPIGPRRQALMNVLGGRSVFDVVDIAAQDVLDDAPLACAVEMALWDVVGQLCGQPLCNLWGGIYRPRIPITVRLPDPPAVSPEDVAREFAEQGYHALMLSSRGDVDQDVAAAGRVQEVAGGRLLVCLDARWNFSWDQALELCQRLSQWDLQYVLDPLSEGNPESIAALARQTSVPLAASRNVKSPTDVLALARTKEASAAVIHPGRCGGMLAARRCAAVAEAAALPAALDSSGSLGILLAAVCHLAAAEPALNQNHLSDYPQLQQDVLIEPIEIVDGTVTLPQNPGLGIEVDRARVDGLQIS